jgi:hypothetical protein
MWGEMILERQTGVITHGAMEKHLDFILGKMSLNRGVK